MRHCVKAASIGLKAASFLTMFTVCLINNFTFSLDLKVRIYAESKVNYPQDGCAVRHSVSDSNVIDKSLEMAHCLKRIIKGLKQLSKTSQF